MVTAAILVALGGLVVPACGGSSTSSKTPAPATNSAGPIEHVFQGTTNSGSNQTARVDCSATDGGYVQREPGTGPNIFDRPHVSLDGSDPGVTHTVVAAEDSVAWGHVGSRLATKVATDAASASHPKTQKHFKLTLFCTKSQDDAWVIAG